MATINLLPWREERRQEKQKELFVIFGGVLFIGLIVIFGWDLWVNGRIDWQNSRNQLIESEIAILDKKIEEIQALKRRRDQMLERMEVILSLQGNRPDIVKVYDEFVRSMPDGIYFVEMTKQSNNVSLVGYAESNSRISSLMRRLDAAKMFNEPNLTKVEANDLLGEQGSRFEMQIKIVTNTEKSEGA
jgi:type IV pilus assembly protein PilN